MSSSPKKRGKDTEVVRQPWTLDAATYVCVEACDGHRIMADRNCVAVARRLADQIPPLIPPPPPPVDPKRSAKKDEPPPPPPKNRGPSAVTPLFDAEVGPGNPTAVGGPGTAVVPVVKVDCLDGRQLEAAMRIAYLKYVGDYIPDPAMRKAISLEKLNITAEELMSIGTILGL